MRLSLIRVESQQNCNYSLGIPKVKEKKIFSTRIIGESAAAIYVLRDVLLWEFFKSTNKFVILKRFNIKHS